MVMWHHNFGAFCLSSVWVDETWTMWATFSKQWHYHSGWKRGLPQPVRFLWARYAGSCSSVMKSMDFLCLSFLISCLNIKNHFQNLNQFILSNQINYKLQNEIHLAGFSVFPSIMDVCATCLACICVSLKSWEQGSWT